jgi:hypothetical protein
MPPGGGGAQRPVSGVNASLKRREVQRTGAHPWQKPTSYVKNLRPTGLK